MIGQVFGYQRYGLKAQWGKTNVFTTQYVPLWRLHFPHFISRRWWNKKLICGNNVSSCIHRKITKFTFKSNCKKTNSKLVNDLTVTSWASQFKYMYSHIGPPINN